MPCDCVIQLYTHIYNEERYFNALWLCKLNLIHFILFICVKIEHKKREQSHLLLKMTAMKKKGGNSNVQGVID